MIAYKTYQLPPGLLAHPATRQINTSAASLCQPGLGEGPGACSRAGTGWKGQLRGFRSPSCPWQQEGQSAGTGGGFLAQEMFKQVYLGEARGNFRAPHPTNLIGKAAPKAKRWVHFLYTCDGRCKAASWLSTATNYVHITAYVSVCVIMCVCVCV